MKASLPLIALAVLLSVPAFAAPRHLSVPLGETKAVSVSDWVEQIEVANPEVVEAKRRSDGAVVLTPKALGKSAVTLRTENDIQVDLVVYVTSGGDVEVISPK